MQRLHDRIEFRRSYWEGTQVGNRIVTIIEIHSQPRK